MTVTANNATKVYGAATPALSNTITGFKNGQDASVVTGSATPTSATSATTGVGTSVIVSTPGTLASGNYTFSYTNGTLTINPATLTVTTNASTKVYGDALPTFSSTVVGLVNSDTTSAATYSTLGTASSNVGTYSVTTALTAGANYTVGFVAGNLTVTKATLTATAADATKVYGDANPALSTNVTGFINGDTAGTALGLTASTANSTATALTSVGTSAITVTAGTANNYNITPVAGVLTITSVPVVIPPVQVKVPVAPFNNQSSRIIILEATSPQDYSKEAVSGGGVSRDDNDLALLTLPKIKFNSLDDKEKAL